MKCKNCGFTNRQGVKYCEECGQLLKVEISPVCPSCGFKNRKGVKFCEECGNVLVAAPAASPSPLPRKESVAQMAYVEPIPQPPQVVEVEGEKKKRRLNTFWLLLIFLLLIISCCCLLLLFDVFETPAFAANLIDPVLDPIADAVRGIIPDGAGNVVDDVINGGVKNPEQPTCEEFRGILKSAKLDQDTFCTDFSCYTDLHDIEFFEGMKVSYRWDQTLRKEADCKERDGFIRCSFPRDPNADKVSYSISLDTCVENLGYSDGWLDSDVPAPPEPPLSNNDTCCLELKVTKTGYVAPTVKRLLEIELSCENGNWGLDTGECMQGETYIGEDRDIFWTDVECCLNDEDILHCESPKTVDQKKSQTNLIVSNDNCYWEVEFKSPYYAPSADGECPAGEEMCYGSCCSIGHCSGGGCY